MEQQKQQQKSFWNKYGVFIVAALTLLFIYGSVVFNQKINFLLGNELIVYLTPQQKSLFMHYGNLSKVDFDMSIDNVAYCKASCYYSFNDRSRNAVIDAGYVEISKEQHFTKSYEVSAKRLGSGQDIYSFDVECSSIRTLLCLTNSQKISRSSLITVNYDLTEIEKQLKSILKQNVTNLLEILGKIDVEHQKLNQKFFEFGFKANLNSLIKDKTKIDDEYDKIRIAIENLRSVWSVENYIKLSQVFNGSFFVKLENISISIIVLNSAISDIVDLHNDLLSQLELLSHNSKELHGLASMLDDGEALNSIADNAANFNKLASSLVNNTFGNYTEMVDGIDNITSQQKLIMEKLKIPSAALFFNYAYTLENEKNLLCKLKQDCKENISIIRLIKDTEEFIDKHPNSGPLKQSCNSLKELSQEYSNIRNQSLSFIADKTISFPSDEEFLKLAEEFLGNERKRINNSYHASFEKILSENRMNSDAIKIANSILPYNKTGITPLNYNQSINISLYLLSKINLSSGAKVLTDKCQKLVPLEELGDFNFERISRNLSYKITSRIETSLSDNPPICCVFNECEPCCKDESCINDPKTFPIMFLHGHSLAKDNSPEFSLDSFNKMQSKLQQDGYLSAGIVSLYSKNEPSQTGIWGLSGKPVTIKASYYYDAFRKEDKYIVVPTKSENIDTYALRLRELIDIVKERTNKPKVNIIAHSMGGLVARRYIQIFGEDNIDKLIMIATPNKGVSGALSDYCRLIGENRECKDMQEDSLFINKLNDPFKQLTKVKLYVIVGQGCKMELGDGDGIVLSESAKLDNADLYYVNGACGGIFGDTLHTALLDVEEYPQVYEIVKEILIE